MVSFSLYIWEKLWSILSKVRMLEFTMIGVLNSFPKIILKYQDIKSSSADFKNRLLTTQLQDSNMDSIT